MKGGYEKEGRTCVSEGNRLDLVDIVEYIVDNCSQGLIQRGS